MDCAKKALTDASKDNSGNPDKFKEVSGLVIPVSCYYFIWNTIVLKCMYSSTVNRIEHILINAGCDTSFFIVLLLGEGEERTMSLLVISSVCHQLTIPLL